MTTKANTERVGVQTAKPGIRRAEFRSHLNDGPRCGFCAYEVSGDGATVEEAPAATTTIEVKPGEFRQVCALHATMRGWRARGRRVGAVAR